MFYLIKELTNKLFYLEQLKAGTLIFYDFSKCYFMKQRHIILQMVLCVG